jgi:hypothetical protein
MVQITNKTALLKFAIENEDWYLERCRGVILDHWWWMRSSKDSSKTVPVDGRAVGNVATHFVLDSKASDKYGSSVVYRLKPSRSGDQQP